MKAGETWKAVLLGLGVAIALAVGGWAWHRWKNARNRIYDPLLIREKVARMAFDGEVQVVVILPRGTRPQRARHMLGQVAAAYRHYDHPAGARFRAGRMRPVVPDPQMLYPSGPEPLRQPEHPGGKRGGGPLAPAGGKGRDTPGGPFRGEGVAAHGPQREGRRPRGRYHFRYPKENSFPR